MDQHGEVRSPRRDRRSDRKEFGYGRRRRDRARSSSESVEEDQEDRRHRRKQYSPPSEEGDNALEDSGHRKSSHRHRSRSAPENRRIGIIVETETESIESDQDQAIAHAITEGHAPTFEKAETLPRRRVERFESTHATPAFSRAFAIAERFLQWYQRRDRR